MNSFIRTKWGFALGSFLFVLTLIIIFSFRFSETPENSPYNDSKNIVSTNDPFITKQLSERDLLPSDIPLVTILDPTRGPIDAPVVIVEFSDFECPYCKDSQKIIERILARYPDTVRHVWKDAPSTSLHKNAFNAHLAARCAQEQNAFWQYHDLLFENQSQLGIKSTFSSIANRVSMNVRQFEQCFDTQAGKARVERSIVEAEVLGVDATPYFFVNNRRLSGSITFEEFDRVIAKELQ